MYQLPHLKKQLHYRPQNYGRKCIVQNREFGTKYDLTKVKSDLI